MNLAETTVGQLVRPGLREVRTLTLVFCYRSYSTWHLWYVTPSLMNSEGVDLVSILNGNIGNK